MKYFKRILSFIFVFVICFVLMAQPVYAVGALSGQQFGAWIASALTAINIVGQSILPAPGPVDPYFNWLSSPASQTIMDYQYPYNSSIISDYLNASTIKVSQGVTTIDGVVYDELWLGPGASRALKTNIFDFKTKWQLLSGQTGTFAEGWGTSGGVPIFDVSGEIKSQTAIVDDGSIFGNYAFKYYAGKNYPYYVIYNGEYTFKTPQFPWSVRMLVNNGWARLQYYDSNNNRWYDRGVPNVPALNEPFKFDYVNGIIPASEDEIPDDYGISIKIPHEKLQTFYNTYPQYNVDNTTINIAEDNVDIDELTQAIFDMIDSIDDMKVDWSNGEEPEPPIPVDPIENIDQNVSDISEYQQDMEQNIDHMHQDVESIHQTQLEQQQTQQEMQEFTESIDDTLKDIKNGLEPGDITTRTFDLRELFPFCIPFDIYHLLQKFNAEPVAPHVQLPFVIQSIGFSYMFDLDFSAFDPVAEVMRTVEFIVFAIGLAWATSKVIKW